MDLIRYFNSNSLFELAERALQLVTNQDTIQVKEVKIFIEKLKGNHEEALKNLNAILEVDPKNRNLLLEKGEISYLSSKLRILLY
jgi:hypothetical protein